MTCLNQKNYFRKFEINPNFSEVEKERMVNKMWANYGKTFIEYIFLNNFKKNLIT